MKTIPRTLRRASFSGLLVILLSTHLSITNAEASSLTSTLNKTSHSKECATLMSYFNNLKIVYKNDKTTRALMLNETKKDIEEKCPSALHKFFVIK